MSALFSGSIVTWLGVLVTMGVVSVVSVMSHLGVEHAVTEHDAKIAAKTLTPELMVGIGCKNCSSQELAYCNSPDAIRDHCCCDRRFHEVFPYIPHTCYLEMGQCRTVAAHCGEFARIVLCCCHRVLATKWKNIANSSQSQAPDILVLTFLVLIPSWIAHHVCRANTR